MVHVFRPIAYHYSMIKLPDTLRKTLLGTYMYTSISLLPACSTQPVNKGISYGTPVAIEAPVEPVAQVSLSYESDEEPLDVDPAFLAQSLSEPGSYMTARLYCGSALDPNFEFPCQNIRVALKDDDGKTVQSLRSSDGEFVFLPEADRSYHMEVLTSDYLPPTDLPALKMGDQIILHLVEQPKSLAGAKRVR